MIRDSLSNTKRATFCIELPNAGSHGIPTPAGTGFFVSPDGWFLTAAHVVSVDGSPHGAVRPDIAQCHLTKESRPGMWGASCQSITVDTILPAIDLALLHVDFAKNSKKEWLKGALGFPHIEISSAELEEGVDVYSFGYPLSRASLALHPGFKIGSSQLNPRVTSAIVSSTLDQTEMVMSSADPKVYVLDKALNYGNSGGPIVSSDTGRVHAFCSRFQPVMVPQIHLKDSAGKPLNIMIPSLYGIVSRLDNPLALDLFKTKSIPVFR